MPLMPRLMVLRPLRLILVRHGEPAASGAQKFGAGLSNAGREQAQRVADYIGMDTSVRTVYSSSLPRARETADIVSARVGCHAIVLPDLEEIHLGDWEGMEPADIRRAYPELVAKFSTAPEEVEIPGGGEKVSHFTSRVRAAARQILAASSHGTIVIVAHRISIAFMICELLGCDIREFTRFMVGKDGKKPGDGKNFCAISVLVRENPTSPVFCLTHLNEAVTPPEPQGDRRFHEHLAFLAISFSIAVAVFVGSFPFVERPLTLTNPKLTCWVISVSGYLRYLFKYWNVWLRMSPLTKAHDQLNWAIMLVGSATAAFSVAPPAFLAAWSVLYLLVASKEAVALKEYKDAFILTPLLEHLKKKVGFAITKAAAFLVLAALLYRFGQLALAPHLSLAVACLWLILLWTIYAAVRDVLRFNG